MASAAYDACRFLLDTAKINVAEEEFEQLVEAYAIVREKADSLHSENLDDETPALIFDPREHFS